MTLEVRKTGSVVDVRPPLAERARTYALEARARATTVSRRHAWTVWQIARQVPRTLVLLVAYTPRGLGRVTAAWARYLRDNDTAELRSHHAGQKETGDYVKASQVRSANLTARIMVNGSIALVVLAIALAWWAPTGLGVLLAGLVFVWTVKLIPGKSAWEYVAAAGVALVAYLVAPRLAELVPRPPGWMWWTAGAVAVVALGWVGRPRAQPLVTLPEVNGGRVPPLTAPMVTAALCALGNSKMKEPDSIRLLMDVARHGQGYQIDLELPPAVPAADVIEKREELAAALRRELGTVWPAVGPRHPGHLSLFVSDVPMATARQAPWPLLKGAKVSLFDALPLFTDQRGQWVVQTLAYTAWVIGAVPRMGKTVALRILGLVAALDVRVKLYVFDLKGTGDLSALAQVAHAYGVGDEPEDVEQQLKHMRQVREEMRSRTRLVRELSLEENPDRGKVTDQLATRDPRRFGPIVVLVDEVQVWTQEFSEPLPSALPDEDDDDGQSRERRAKDPGKVVREEFIAILRDLVKRGPALGIIPIMATQKPDAKSIPSSIADNASARLCLKVNGQISNDQILGTSSYQAGIRATQFAFSDKGIAYFRGDGAEPLVVRTVFGIDAAAADELAARARALRAAAGLLTGQAAGNEPDVPVLDIWADVQRVLADRGRRAAQHAELVEWLRELRLDYARLDVDELSARLRARRVAISQVWSNGRNAKGVDLRKQDQA